VLEIAAQLARALADLRETRRNQSLHERLRQWLVDGEVKGTLGHRVTLKVIGKRSEDGAAERQVTQVVLECGETGNRLAVYPEGWHPVGEHLLGVWDDLEDRPAQCLERAALRLVDTSQVPVNLPSGQRNAV
jgi:NADPH-dependent 2,4-dienoyl-CoA reductase/sulfur reductase-like enzyme